MNSAALAALLLSFLLSASCILREHGRQFRVVPKSPKYLLKSPDARKIPFDKVLRNFNGFERGQSWIDLRPLMRLHIEDAYYEKGASRRGLAGFLGTETADYDVTSGGLRLLSFQPMKNRPPDEEPVQNLIARPELHFRYYRFYFELVFAPMGDSHGSALLGANSIEELNQLSDQLTQTETVCDPTSLHCTVFPEACSVSVEIEIVVNGKSQSANWGAPLASVAAHPQHLEMKRLFAGQLAPVKINPHDPGALGLPLLPGDEITWN